MFSHRLVLTASTLLLAACGPSIQFDRDESVPIPAGATYAYPPEDHSQDFQADPREQNTIVQGRLQRALDAQLQRLGYRRVNDIQQAQFVARYFWSIERRTEMQMTAAPMMGPMMGPGMGMGMGMGPGMGMGWGWGWGWGGGMGMGMASVPVTIKEGTFLFDLINIDTRKLAWRATWIGEPRNRAPTQAELNDKAADLLARAPKAR